MKLKPGPITLEVAFTLGNGKSSGVELFAGWPPGGLRFNTFGGTRSRSQWAPDGGHPLLFLPNPERRVELAVVFDGKQMLTFDGGKLIDRGPASDYKPENVTRTFTMADQGFVGRMHQVRVSSVARYKADYKPVRRFTPDKDTIALYRFDEGKGDKLTDYSGNNHHGKIVGGTWLKSFTTPYWTPTLDQLLALNSIISQEGHDAVTHKLREVNHGTCDIEFEPKEGPPKRCVIKSVATHTIWPLAASPASRRWTCPPRRSPISRR